MRPIDEHWIAEPYEHGVARRGWRIVTGDGRVVVDHVESEADALRIAGPRPVCEACEGKGWLSLEDVERGLVRSGDVFNAGYEAGKNWRAVS